MSTSATFVELLVYGYIRQKVETNKSWILAIPDPIKVFCKKYHGLFGFTESKILNAAQQLNLWRLLSQKIKFQQTTLLYNALSDGFTIAGFYKNIIGKSPTVIIAHTNYGDIYGVFTTFKWARTANCTHGANDEHGFVWLLKSDKGDHIKPQIFAYNYLSMGVSEGGWSAYIMCNVGSAAFALQEHCNIKQNNVACSNIHLGIKDASVLCGGNQLAPGFAGIRYSFGCVDIEIFQINEPYEFL